MHSSSHPPRTFHNRSARYLGVLVAAALVAALGLPSVAQAQSIAPTVDWHRRYGRCNDGFATITATWTTRLGRQSNVNNWIVTVTKPGGAKTVVNERRNCSKYARRGDH